MRIQKIKIWGGGGVRFDVEEELKVFGKFTKKNWGGGGGGSVAEGVRWGVWWVGGGGVWGRGGGGYGGSG